MTTYIGMTIGGIMLTVLHFGMQPKEYKAPESALKIELRAMYKTCLDKQGPDCDVINRVMTRTN